MTIEDPIEIVHDDETCIVSQREVGIDTESFSEALRRVLRQDPDVILIGEMRDRETAETALQAAESGHLVLSTMHTLDAAETIRRLVEFFPAEKHAQMRSILAGVLRGVISQRLLPRVDGGRIAAVEVMVANNRIQELIRENRPELDPRGDRRRSLLPDADAHRALIDLVVTGEIDEETAAAAAPNRHDFMIALERALKEKEIHERRVARGGTRTPTRPRSCRRASSACSDATRAPAYGAGGRAWARLIGSGPPKTASRWPRCSSSWRSSEWCLPG